jgi:hypothetical protein
LHTPEHLLEFGAVAAIELKELLRIGRAKVGVALFFLVDESAALVDGLDDSILAVHLRSSFCEVGRGPANN